MRIKTRDTTTKIMVIQMLQKIIKSTLNSEQAVTTQKCRKTKKKTSFPKE